MMRWPIVLLIVALLAAGVSYDRVEHVATAPAEPPAGAVVDPVLRDPAPLSSAWYCPVGSAGPGYADQTIEIANIGTELAVATVGVLTETGPGPSLRIEVGAGARRSIALGDLETAPVAGAIVEVTSGWGVVDHIVASPHGPVRGPCATGASDQWHFAGGATTRDATYHLALLNPFPEDAVIDVAFEASDRSRVPSDLQGAIVPARSVRVIEVGESVAREGAVATTVSLRRGLVVAERLQSFNGVLGPVGSALQLGSPGPSLESWFPAGRVHAGGDQRLVLYNPGDEVAEIDVELQPHDPGLTAAYGLVPLEVSIGPGRFEIVDLVATATQLGVPLPFEVGLHVRSVNGVPVVGERWSLAPPLDRTAIGAGTEPAPAAPAEASPPAEAPGTPPVEGAPTADAPVPGATTSTAEEPAPPAAADPATAATPAPEGPAPVDPNATDPGATTPVEPAPTPGGSAPTPVEPAPPAGGPAPPADAPAPPTGDPGAVEEHEHADVPAEEAPSSPSAPPPPPQSTATSGVVIDGGSVVAASRWVLPGTPMLAGEGTALVVVGVDDASSVEVRALAVGGGTAEAATTTFEVSAGQRVIVALTSPEAVEDLVVESTGRVVVAASVVDAGGSLTVLGGIPVLERTS